MNILKVIILGLVQGFTEFLPISSSGHLVLAEALLDFHESGIAFEVFVHLGTLLAVLVYFRRDIRMMLYAPWQKVVSGQKDAILMNYILLDLYIIIGTIPAGVIGLLFKDQIEAIFSSVVLVVITLSITGSFLILSRFLPARNLDINGWRGLGIGIAQAVAILPGISRSGSTIVTGMALGLPKEEAAKFSFLLSIPAILGATVLKIRDLLAVQMSAAELLPLLIGMVVAFISGYVAIIWLLDLVKKGRLDLFGYYCLAVAGIALVWFIA